MKKQAQAAGHGDRERNLTDVIRVAEERSIFRKLTAITKRNKDGALGRIEVATHDWFHSTQTRELYHYNKGNFEAYPHKDGDSFFAHHFLKVLPVDAKQVLAEKDEEGYWRIDNRLDW